MAANDGLTNRFPPRPEWVMPKATVAIGQHVKCNGYPGVVVGLGPSGMCTVRLDRGDVCVSISELLRFNR